MSARWVLPDTSLWVQHLRGVPATTSRLKPHIDQGTAALCEPVMMELLAGAPKYRAAVIERLGRQLPSLPFDGELDFRVAADLVRRVRVSGHTLRSPVDALIAAVVLRHPDVVLVHDDVDFERISAVAPLRQERWTRAG